MTDFDPTTGARLNNDHITNPKVVPKPAPTTQPSYGARVLVGLIIAVVLFLIFSAIGAAQVKAAYNLNCTSTITTDAYGNSQYHSSCQ